MTSRSHGRPTPSRGARVEQRKEQRGPTTQMTSPAPIRALSPPKPPRRLPCLVDPDCRVDHLHRKRKGARRG